MKLPASKAGIKNYLLVARKWISNFYICRLHPQNDPMKKIVLASLFLLSAAGFFFACQKETTVTATEVAASNTESITQRDDETPCSLQVTISGALGTYLCGTLPADPIPGDARCTVCLNDYSIFIINSNAVTRTMLGNVFSIKKLHSPLPY